MTATCGVRSYLCSRITRKVPAGEPWAARAAAQLIDSPASLKPGQLLGPYRIDSFLAAGGMGEVYRATDTRLHRQVAIKVSAAPFSERFEREARVVASLNHPHICHLYDVGPNYLVMEYVEGSELKGPLPLDQALKLAIQLASALEAAHRKTITHRDLKPANILVTKAGVKVLDFGLAKIEQTKEAKANDETLTRPLTQEGSIVGTLQYMAPEQLQGKPTDNRTDLFAFGCVLYEMLTGKRAFDGANNASVIAAILERPAPSVKEVAPAALDRVLGLCLEKDPDERWQTAHDLKAELMWIASGEAEIRRQIEGRSSDEEMDLGRGVLTDGGYRRAGGLETEAHAAVPVTRTVIGLGPDEQLANLNGTAVAISPDGSKRRLCRQPRRRSRAALPAPVGRAEGRATRRDGRRGFSLLFAGRPVDRFFRWQQAGKGELGGGEAVTICEVGGGSSSAFPGAVWTPHDIIVFQGTGWFREVPATGGTPHRATMAGKGGYRQWRWLEFTPGGAAMVFASGTNPISFAGKSSITVATLGGVGTARELMPGTAPRLTATGDLLYAQNGTLMVVPFNSKRLELAGTPSQVLDGILETSSGAAQYSLSANGTLVYIPGGIQNSTSRWFG